MWCPTKGGCHQCACTPPPPVWRSPTGRCTTGCLPVFSVCVLHPCPHTFPSARSPAPSLPRLLWQGRNSPRSSTTTSLIQLLRTYHGLGCFAVIVGVYGLHYFDVVDCSKLLFLSYVQPPAEPGAEALYKTGSDDLWFVSFWVVVLTSARLVVQKFILTPLGACGQLLGGIRRARVCGWETGKREPFGWPPRPLFPPPLPPPHTHHHPPPPSTPAHRGGTFHLGLWLWLVVVACVKVVARWARRKRYVAPWVPARPCILLPTGVSVRVCVSGQPWCPSARPTAL
jgi:hypothetical protein